MKDELVGETLKEFVALLPRMHSYLMHDGHIDKRAQDTKKCVIKRGIKFADYIIFQENNKTTLRSQQWFRNEIHNVFIEKINKIALIANGYKRTQTPDEVATYPLSYALEKYAD